MSASSKKKLRKEQNAAVLTERQQKEKAEAKKLKITTTIFVVIMALILVTALVFGIIDLVNNSVLVKKNTTALTVGEHKINSIELNYYFVDAINSSYNEWSTAYGEYVGAALAMMGLDVSLPLDEQSYMYDETQTWADYFMQVAVEQATANYALYDQAIANGYTADEEVQASIDSNMNMFNMYAVLAQTTPDKYIEMYYGKGSDEASYREYMEVKFVASTFYNDYEASLTYDDAAIRAHEDGRQIEYNGYTYDAYLVSYAPFLPEGAAEDPTEDQIAAAVAEAKATADSLATATTLEELNAAIAALEINAGKEVAATHYRSQLYTYISTNIRDWVTDEARQENDITVIPYETVADHDHDENVEHDHEYETQGYYVVMFHSSTDNNQPKASVRHLLVSFEADEDGNISKQADMAAKSKADGYLNEWLSGEATEESFIKMVELYSADTASIPNGGLFENITPDSSYVDGFLDWCIDPARTAGETAVVPSEYGYHVMFFVGHTDQTYRDMMIVDELREADLAEWYNGIISVEVTEGNLGKINTSVVLDSNA